MIKRLIILVISVLLVHSGYSQQNNVLEFWNNPKNLRTIKKNYGIKFTRDVKKLQKEIALLPDSIQMQFHDNVLTYMNYVDNRRIAYDNLRRRNMRIRNAGIAITALSTALGVSLPFFYYKETSWISANVWKIDIDKNSSKSIIFKETGEFEILPVAWKVKDPKKATIITSTICGAGVLTGLSCIVYYLINRNTYDAGFSLANGLFIKDNGLGVVITKTF